MSTKSSRTLTVFNTNTWMNPTVKTACVNDKIHSWLINRNRVSGKREIEQIRSCSNSTMLRANPQLSKSIE